MCLGSGDPQFCLHPSVGLRFCHQSGSPHPVKCLVCLDPLVPQVSIRKAAHGQLCFSVGAHIGIAGRITVADIQQTSRTGSITKDIACRMQRRFCPAVGAVDIWSFRLFTSVVVDQFPASSRMGQRWGSERFHSSQRLYSRSKACRLITAIHSVLSAHCPVWRRNNSVS